MGYLLWMAAVAVVVLLIAWAVRRFHRRVDEVDDDGYQGPPPVHGHGGPH